MEYKVNKRKVYVVGHKNPDTDSICSAIAYARLQAKITGKEYTPRRAGQLNEETQYVLERFNMRVPPLLSDLRVQVKDVELRKVEGLGDSVSIKTAWARMKELNIKTLPVTREGKLEGLITIGDIATSYMDVYDRTILSRAGTKYRNVAAAIEGTIVTGNDHSYIPKGKVGVVASSCDLLQGFVEQDDLVILGNQEETMECAIDLNVGSIVVCQGEEVSSHIISKAKNKEIVIICTPHDIFTVARLINQSIPVKHFMTTEGLISFKMQEYMDDVKDVMGTKKYRDFPVLDRKGGFLGFISRRRMINCRKKQVILVDHNEKNQAVDGIEEADVLGIIDHHRLSSIQTMAPVYFRNQPVGCTSTIIYQIYQEEGVEVEPLIAGLLCSAIISDTLMFRSPTCTPIDETSAKRLAEIAGVDIEELALGMFHAGSNLRGKTGEEIMFLDFKQFTVNETVIGVGQVNSMSESELKEIKSSVLSCLEQGRRSQNLDMVFFMLTNIVTESSELLCCGDDAKEKVVSAFDLREDTEDVFLKGVVSRKKQLVPTLVAALHQ